MTHRLIIDAWPTLSGWTTHILDHGVMENVGPLPLHLDATTTPDDVRAYLAEVWPDARIIISSPYAS